MSESDRFEVIIAPPPPSFRTARLILRQPRPSDEELLLPIRNLPRTLAALNKPEITIQRMRENLDQVAQETMMAQAYSAVIELATSGAVIGMVRLDSVVLGVRASLTVWVGHDQLERGCGLEAAREMVAWGFEKLALRTTVAEVFESNPPSVSMLSALGFKESGAEERETRLGWRKVTKYSLSRDAWAAAASS